MVDLNGKPDVPMLKEVKLFQVFQDGELAELLKMGKLLQYEAHSNIVIEGEMTWGLYLILDGLVGVFKTNKLTGDSFDVGQMRTGQFFGEMSLVDDNPRSATVRALSETYVFNIPKQTFNDFLGQSPDRRQRFYDACIKDLSGRLRELSESFIETQYQLWKTAVNQRKEAA
jgi:CRP-like cAMP-binding protein